MIAQPPIPVPKAEAAIVRYFGSGTAVTKCRRFSLHLIGCEYETPLINVGIEAGGEGWSDWHGFATVDRRGVHAYSIE